MQLHLIDYSIMLIYVAFVVGIGFALKRYMKTSADFFLSGRSIPAWVCGLAFLSANLGALELVGMAASVGAGISMGFAEALSDDGSLTGRGHPWLRGGICGLMTALGGVGHTLPFLFPNFRTAMVVSAIVVVCELSVISWVRHRYMDTPVFSATTQVMLGGALVFIAGLLIGSA